MHGYDGHSNQRVVATVDGARKVLAWGDDITAEELAGFIAGWPDAMVEIVDDKAAETAAFPTFLGRV